jgi:hypothetical protein
VYENRVLGRQFGPKRDEVAGGWSMNNEKLHNLHTSPNIIKVIKEDEMGGPYSMHRRDEKFIYYSVWETRREETPQKTSVQMGR